MTNINLFIARRLFFNKGNRNTLSKKILNIALAGISLGLAVMIISVAIVIGFKKEIRNKISGFGAHIQIVNFDSNYSYETYPINKNQSFLSDISAIKGIKNIQEFATKPGMIKTEEDIHGVNFKGVGTDYNWDFFQKNLIIGNIPQINDSTRINDILISNEISNLLGINLNDRIYMYFINGDEWPPRVLQLNVCGIYNTNLIEFDKYFIIGDIKHIQRLNDWESYQISGFEIIIENFNKLDELETEIRNIVVNYRNIEGETLRTISITRKYPQLFDWLNLTNMNVWVILTLIIVVTGFNMISGLLVLILERSTMIGVLKALGSPNWDIRKVFLYLSGFLLSRGLLWGNILGISLVLFQKFFHVIHLDSSVYYIDIVPVNISILHLFLLNIGTMAIILSFLFVPSYFISKISPEKIIRFD